MVQPESHHGEILVYLNPDSGKSSFQQTVAYALMIWIVRRQKPDVVRQPATTSAIERMPKLLDASGQFANDDIPKRLSQQAEGFVEFVEKLSGKKLR